MSDGGKGLSRAGEGLLEEGHRWWLHVEGQQAQGERDRKGEGGHEAGTSFSQRRGDAEKRGETAHAKRTGGFLLTQLSYLLLFGSRNLRAISVILDTPP